MVAILVTPWTNYQLYFRDPETRQFKPLVNLDGSKWSVRFTFKNRKFEPLQLIKWEMQAKTGTDLDKRYSRKKDLQYINL